MEKLESSISRTTVLCLKCHRKSFMMSQMRLCFYCDGLYPLMVKPLPFPLTLSTEKGGENLKSSNLFSLYRYMYPKYFSTISTESKMERRAIAGENILANQAVTIRPGHILGMDVVLRAKSKSDIPSYLKQEGEKIVDVFPSTPDNPMHTIRTRSEVTVDVKCAFAQEKVVCDNKITRYNLDGVSTILNLSLEELEEAVKIVKAVKKKFVKECRTAEIASIKAQINDYKTETEQNKRVLNGLLARLGRLQRAR